MSNVYNRGKTVLTNGVVDWDGATDVEVMLVTAAYVYNVDNNVRADVTNEITNGGYARQNLAGRTVTQDDPGNRAVLDATDLVFAALAAGDLPAAAIVYRNSGAAATDDLICYCAIGVPIPPNGLDYTIVWSALGVCRLNDS